MTVERRRRRLPAALVLAVGALLIAAPSALAAQQVISSAAGPLTNIYLNDNLACSATHAGDQSPEFYGGTNPGACGTFLSTGEVSYGPTVPADNEARTELTPVGQSAVTGTGVAGDPFKVTTVADAGRTGLRITQTDTYIIGQESYRTDIAVANSTKAPISASLYHAGDCFLQNDDHGYGFHDAGTGGIFCSVTPNNTPADRIVGFVPVGTGSHFIEAQFSAVWSAIPAAGTQFPDSCLCDNAQDNGAGLSWALTVPANGAVKRSLITTFSPEGAPPETTPPDTALTGGPTQGSTTTVTTPTFEFSSDQPAATFECRVDGAAFASCASPYTTAPLTLGPHTFEVRAVNGAQEADPTPVAISFTVATPPPTGPPSPPTGPTSPPPGSTAPSASGGKATTARGKTFSGAVALFTDPAGLPASAYDVTIDWGDGTTSPGALRPRAVSGQFDVVGTHTYLTGGTYTVTARIVQRGTARVARASGSVAVSGPTVRVGKSFIGDRVSGTVKYRRPGARKFVVLRGGRELPIGSLIDTRKGRVRITWTTGRPNDVRVVDHYAGLFRLEQARKVGALINSRLAGALVGCSSGKAAAFEARRRRRGRRLWGSGRGGRTTGRSGAATVRGTIWLTQDNCDGSTLVVVRKGRVSVRDFVRRKTVTVPAGKRYTTGKRRLP